MALSSSPVTFQNTPSQRTQRNSLNMNVKLVFLYVTCFFVNANSTENIYPDNGWRPMSIEKILKLQRDFIKTPYLHFVKTSQNPTESPAIINDFENKHFVEITQKLKTSKNTVDDHTILPIPQYHENKNSEYQESIKLVEPTYKETTILEDAASELDNRNDFNTIEQRKAKSIENSNVVLNLENAIIDQRKTNKRTDGTNERSIIIDSSKTYAVKEYIEGDNQSGSNQKLFYVNELKHETPKTEPNVTKNNLTANLLDILANYNIRSGDKLQNYDKSLRQNSRSSDNHDFIFLPVPMKEPIRYNNANHLPVDPLLAVFLSNYGHYIPSLYGFHSGYNNLYGYLASNNIHNNKPFGSYKIFSDTDTLH